MADQSIEDPEPAVIAPPPSMGLLRNVGWTMLATASRAIATGLALLLLSRLVSPATMAVYGLGWAISTLGLSLSQNGAAQGLIALNKLTPQHVTAARILSLAISGALGLLVALAAPLVDRLYRLEGLYQSLLIAAAFIPAMSLSTVDVAMSQRKLDFRVISIIQAIAATIAAAFAVLLAYFGYGLIALYALQGLVGPVAYLCFKLSGRSAGLSHCGLSHFRDLWRFGSHLSVGSLSGVIWLNFPQFLLGRMVGAEVLGQFVFCQRIVQLIATQLGGGINTVIFPTFAALSDPRDIGRAYLRTAPLTFLVQAVPLLLLVVAPAGFLALYGGQQWIAASKTLYLLAIMQFGLLLGSNVFPTFQALGRSAVIWQWNLMLLTFQVCVIALFGLGGILPLMQSLVGSMVIMPLCAWWLLRTVGLPFRLYLTAMLPVVIACVAAAMAGGWVASWVPGPGWARVGGAWAVGLTVLMFVFVALDANVRAQVRRLARRIAA